MDRWQKTTVLVISLTKRTLADRNMARSSTSGRPLRGAWLTSVLDPSQFPLPKPETAELKWEIRFAGVPWETAVPVISPKPPLTPVAPRAVVPFRAEEGKRSALLLPKEVHIKEERVYHGLRKIPMWKVYCHTIHNFHFLHRSRNRCKDKSIVRYVSRYIANMITRHCIYCKAQTVQFDRNAMQIRLSKILSNYDWILIKLRYFGK